MSMVNDEQDLVRRLHGDEESVLADILGFLELRTRRALMVRFAGTATDADLEDALSIALFRLWQSRHKFDPAKASLGTFFYLLARNALIDSLRERSRSEIPDRIAERRLVPPGKREELRRRLMALLPSISMTDRHILVTTEPDAELAAKMNISEGALRVKRHRLRKRLRQQLGIAVEVNSDEHDYPD
ncbi:MAG: sigma-70 family RNA polymerase sigma factor [Acidobacteria bacterium]|nr:sigma-70 family RNA polymerase sigma factor [Acidobacteriota bacterium]